MKNKTIKKGKRGLLRMIFSRTMIITLVVLADFFLLFAFLFELLSGLPILFGSTVLLTALIELYIINSEGSAIAKLSWCFVVALLPIMGIILYFLFRFDIGNRLNRRLNNDSIKESLKFIPEQQDLYSRIRNEDPEFFGIANYLKEKAHAPVFNGTKVEYFPLGEYKFARLLECLESAEKFIFLEYFIIADGEMWGTILDILRRKAAEGVEVRLLYDGMNAIFSLPYSYPKKLAKMGIKAKMYAPLRPFFSTHYNNRDHRKIAVVDGKAAFTGGVNIEDCYINREVKFGHWKDTAVMVTGSAVRSFTLMFLQMWNSGESKKEFAEYLEPCEPCEETEGYVIPYGDTPTDKENVGELVYLDIINHARDYLYIMSPYLILNSELETALKFAAGRGVDIQIILPHIPDKKSAFALAKTHYRELISAGVKLYEYTPGFVHAKVFVSDDRCGVVGTINLDYRSLCHHFECAAYLYRVPAISDILRDFEETREKSHCVTLKDVKKESFFMRVLGALLKPFAPLM